MSRGTGIFLVTEILLACTIYPCCSFLRFHFCCPIPELSFHVRYWRFIPVARFRCAHSCCPVPALSFLLPASSAPIPSHGFSGLIALPRFGDFIPLVRFRCAHFCCPVLALSFLLPAAGVLSAVAPFWRSLRRPVPAPPPPRTGTP